MHSVSLPDVLVRVDGGARGADILLSLLSSIIYKVPLCTSIFQRTTDGRGELSPRRQSSITLLLLVCSHNLLMTYQPGICLAPFIPTRLTGFNADR